MRISKKAKKENRNKILDISANLFLEKGYQETTTRNIAVKAGMASGTMFNYFPSKEALAMTLVSEALTKGREAYVRRRTGKEEFAEDLFILITSELRQLKPYRKYIGPVIESGMSLFPKPTVSSEGEKIRQEHLEIVQEAITRHGCSSAPEFILLNLYWSLYLGIIAFWLNDESRNQEETLAFIDYSLHLFSGTIGDSSNR
ncbi:MAG: TetR/AcrR family transcriptional regulator [Thermodesulfobacteriota bacterium]